MAHHDDIIMPLKIRFGSRGSPVVAVDQIFYDSGFRSTNTRWSQYLRSLILSYLDSTEEITLIEDIYMAVGGPADTFLCRDWTDWNSTAGSMRKGDTSLITSLDQIMRNTVTELFVGDGTTTTFQLLKQYAAGSVSHLRDIIKPDSEDFVVAITGVDTTLFTLDVSTGIVTFDSAPSIGEVPTWGGKFYIPVHFLDEELPIVQHTDGAHSLSGLEIMEARLAS